MQISAKARFISLIVALVFMFGTIAGTGIYLIVNICNKSAALDNESAYNIGNMISSANNGQVDLDTYNNLINKLGNDTTSTRNKSQINGGTPIVFQMGEVSGNPIYWEVVYQTGDIITIWMTQSYSREYFNNFGTTQADGMFNGETQTSYSYENGYSRSTLRSATQAVYDELNATYSVFGKVVVSPSNAAEVSSWQASQSNARFSSNYWALTNGLEINSNSGSASSSDINDCNPNGWIWDNCMGDNFWIPSLYEVYNTSTSSYSFNGGLWGLTVDDVSFTNVRLDNGNETSDNNGSCWLRSGSSSVSSFAIQLNTNGSVAGSGVNVGRGIRPACHISLTNLAKCNVNAQSSNTAQGIVTASENSVSYKNNVTFTATPNPGYLFDYWMINGTRYDYNPYTYYVTQDTTAIAYFKQGILISVTSSNTSQGSVAGGGTFESGTLVNLVASPAAGYGFAYWLDSSGGRYTSNPLSVSATSNQTYTAYFTQYYVANITSSNTTFTTDMTRNLNYSVIYNITAPANNYFYGISVNNGAQQVFTSRFGLLDNSGGSTSISYQINENANLMTLEISFITADINIELFFTNSQPPLSNSSGGTNIDGVALQVSASGGSTDLAAVGEARITGYTQTDGLATIHVSAMASSGYRFVGWQVDGETISTLLSADIPYSDVEGKILVAVFAPIGNANNMNGTTDNGYTDDFA